MQSKKQGLKSCENMVATTPTVYFRKQSGILDPAARGEGIQIYGLAWVKLCLNTPGISDLRSVHIVARVAERWKGQRRHRLKVSSPLKRIQ